MNLARNALLLMILLTTGCMALVAGGVAAVGTYTYVSGQLNRTYNTDNRNGLLFLFTKG